MKIRRYTCKDMQEALLKVKMDLGSEAVIMNSRKVKPKGLFGIFAKPLIEVVAAIDDDLVRPSRPNPYQQRPATTYSTYPQPPLRSSVVREDHEPNLYGYTSKEPRTASPEYKAPEPKAQEAIISDASHAKENKRIADLESKVKDMGSILDQIYQAVQVKDQPEQVKKPEAPPVNVPKAIPCEESLNCLRDILFEQDVEPRLIDKIIDKIIERGGHALRREEIFGLAGRVMTVLMGEPEPITIKDHKPHVVLFIGPTGVGKTTTLAKIAADFTLTRQKKVGLITADTYRIAAVEQLKTYAEILNLQVNVVYSPNEIKDAVERLSDNDLILIDTAGRSHKNKAHFNELKTLISAVNADEIFLVMSCNTSRMAIKEICEYYAFIKNYKLLFTKLDESPVPGIILNARYLTGKPLSYTTAGQSVPDDLDIADVRQLATSILAKDSMQIKPFIRGGVEVP